MAANMMLLGTLIILGFVAWTQACSCMPGHPQTMMCDADFGEYREPLEIQHLTVKPLKIQCLTMNLLKSNAQQELLTS